MDLMLGWGMMRKGPEQTTVVNVGCSPAMVVGLTFFFCLFNFYYLLLFKMENACNKKKKKIGFLKSNSNGSCYQGCHPHNH